MILDTLRDLAKHRLNKRTYNDGPLSLEYSNAILLQANRPTSLEAYIYDPLMCLVIQGSKQILAGTHQVKCDAGEMFVVSHHLPVTSRIVLASSSEPYMSLILPLDREILRRYSAVVCAPKSTDSAPAMVSCDIESSLLDVCRRLLELERDTSTAPFMAPLVLDELHMRVLRSAAGSVLAGVMVHDDRAAQINKAISIIREDDAARVSVLNLAKAVGMSKSAFHLHFKTITGLSPIAYAKDLRLIRARTMIKETKKAISTIAREVGYESAAQFSRDYARRFARSPRRDRENQFETE